MMLLSLAAALVTAPIAAAQSSELVHSDLPLWSPEKDADVWPQHFHSGSDFGCSVPIETGIWKYVRSSRDEDSLYRVDNYGAVHCMLEIGEAFEADRFGASRPSFLIKIGRAGPLELWALQVGSLPGSDYLLLSRSPTAGLIGQFNMLQRACPSGHRRDRGNFDLLGTRYCSINSQRELVALARKMATLPPLGTLTFERQDRPDPN